MMRRVGLHAQRFVAGGAPWLGGLLLVLGSACSENVTPIPGAGSPGALHCPAELSADGCGRCQASAGPLQICSDGRGDLKADGGACQGDVNSDGKVTFGDAMAVAGAWGRTEGASNWDSRLDVVPDGKVDRRDFGAVLGNLGCKGTTPSSPVPATGLTGPAGTSGGSGTPDTDVPSVIPLDVASTPGWAEFEDLTIVLINQRRAAGANCGGTWYAPVGPLGFNESIRTAARGHSSDMAEKGYFAHEGLDGSTPMQRMLDAGYDGTAFGENIAAGQRTPEEVVTAWMGSPGHCQNIMHAAFRVTGVGYIAAPASPYKHFWTQNFGN